ncbi:uncharacterized protein DS421_16g564070 [Arachis hypogaea]|nr:uncharacterized protein DS421_16g564070 [Arachis hypogaea]
MARQWKKFPVSGPHKSYLRMKRKLQIAQKQLRRMRRESHPEETPHSEDPPMEGEDEAEVVNETPL